MTVFLQDFCKAIWLRILSRITATQQSATRKIYAGLIRNHNNFEIAETFYNSVYNAVFSHEQIRNDYAFVFSSQGDIPLSDSSPVLRYYAVPHSLKDSLEQLLEDYCFNIPYEDLSRDVDRLVEAFEEELMLVSNIDLNKSACSSITHCFWGSVAIYIW